MKRHAIARRTNGRALAPVPLKAIRPRIDFSANHPSVHAKHIPGPQSGPNDGCQTCSVWFTAPQRTPARETGGRNTPTTMQRPTLLAAALLLATSPLRAAEPSTSTTTTTTILQDFDFLTAHIARNYAGYAAKVNDLTRPALEHHTQSIRAKLEAAKPEQHAALFQQYLQFFHDHHLGLQATPGTAPTASPSEPSPPAPDTVEKIATPFTSESFIKSYEASKSPHTLEGLWQLGPARYVVAVAPSSTSPNALDASIVSSTVANWNPADIKLRIHLPAEGSDVILVDLWTSDRKRRDSAVRLRPNNNAFELAGIPGVWTRLHPIPQSPNEPERATPSPELFLSKLSTKTLWLRVPDFQPQNQPALAALLESNKRDLESTPNLIIDARDNPGGQPIYEPLLALAYTRPIYTPGIETYATPDNIAAYQRYADDPNMPEESRNEINALIACLKSAQGGYVPDPPKGFTCTTFPEVLENPRRIAVLIDNAYGFAEQFIMDIRQSRKVTLIGTSNSAGIIDYVNPLPVPLPSGRFTLHCPISRSLRLPDEPYDNAGIPPDIRIPKNTSDPIAFTQAWLEQQADS